jgi:isopentenyl-diphosphate delta-isomerase
MQVATGRRLQEELGIEVPLEYVYKFRYQARFGEQGSEHELCSVYLGRCVEEIRPNTTEIDAIRFVSPDDLSVEISANAESFTPWFKQEWDHLNGQHAEMLGRFIQPT